MFERSAVLDAEVVRAMGAVLVEAALDSDDAALVDLVRALEELKCVAEGVQARASVAFDRSQRAAQAAMGVAPERQGRGVAAQLGLARRESPHRAQRDLEAAKILDAEMPATCVALRTGRISWWRATLVVRETACLTREHRAEVDRTLCGDPAVAEALSDGELIGRARALAAKLDPASVAERRRRAEAERRVTVRPAPDVMSHVSALLPVRDGVAVWAVLAREADRLRAAGDVRSRGQIMADTLVARVLHDPAGCAAGPGVAAPRLVLNVAVSDEVLLGDEDGAGWVEHYGAVPGDLLREWIAANAEAGAEQWVRRLYVSPESGALVAMDKDTRLFEGRLAQFLRLRDQHCRTPWCDAPIRHLDHAEDHAGGGPTTAANGQGLCQACNHAKQAAGWRARPRPGPGPSPRHTIETTTPTGHTYTSTAPAWSVSERGLAIRLGWVLTA